MELSAYFPKWDKLTPTQQNLLKNNAVFRKTKKGTIIHNGSIQCSGLFLIASGQLRAFILSEDGREISIYRLFERDICLFSASCIMNSIQFDITVEAEKDTELWIIPKETYKQLMNESLLIANYTNELMANRFSEVMWLLEQLLWKSFDKRLAEFLVNESQIEETNQLKITHETIGKHLGNPREVVTRMLKYFQNEGIVKLSRGTIEIIDLAKLENLMK